MSNDNQFNLPAGRIVQGSLSDPQTTDQQGRPLLDRDGNPRVSYFIGMAIPKGQEASWWDTVWGQQIVAHGGQGWRNNETARRDFAWKVIDGDSAELNQKGHAWNSHQGFPGHWVLRLTSGFAPDIVQSRPPHERISAHLVKCGYYIEAVISCKPNGDTAKPGVYLNLHGVGFIGVGEEISFQRDASTYGFGQQQMPAGAQAPVATPAAAPVAQAPAATPAAAPVATPAAAPVAQAPVAQAPVAQAPVTPNPAITQPPAAAPAPQGRVMLPAANGIPYESYIASGWTDAQLVQHGYMQA